MYFVVEYVFIVVTNKKINSCKEVDPNPLNPAFYNHRSAQECGRSSVSEIEYFSITAQSQLYRKICVLEFNLWSHGSELLISIGTCL
jgi:hypothetical protein